MHAQSEDDGDANGHELQRLHGHDDAHDDENGMLFQVSWSSCFMESKSLLLLNCLVEDCVCDGTL